MIILLTTFFTLLPVYLIRFNIGELPTTALEILIWIIIAVWILKKIKDKNFWSVFRARIILSPGLFISMFLFLLGATIGALASSNLRAALGEWRAFYIEPAIIFYILIDSVRETKHRDMIIGGLILCGLATAILAIFQHFTGWLVPYSFWENRDTYRVTAWYGFPNAVGLFLAPIIPFIFYFGNEMSINKMQGTRNKKRVLTVCYVLFVICFLLAIIFAKSTGAIIGLIAGLGIFLLLYKKTRIIALIIAAIGIIGIVFIPNSNPIKQEILARDRSGQLRRDIWSETFSYLKIHPLRGTGMAAYSKEIAPFRRDKTIEVFHHSHNILLTIWVNTGLAGLIGFVGILIWFFFTKSKEQGIRNKELSNVIVIAMVIWLTTGLVDSPYIKNDLAMVFWLMIALRYNSLHLWKS